jgi:hypothetical protein
MDIIDVTKNILFNLHKISSNGVFYRKFNHYFSLRFSSLIFNSSIETIKGHQQP